MSVPFNLLRRLLPNGDAGQPSMARPASMALPATPNIDPAIPAAIASEQSGQVLRRPSMARPSEMQMPDAPPSDPITLAKEQIGEYRKPTGIGGRLKEGLWGALQGAAQGYDPRLGLGSALGGALAGAGFGATGQLAQRRYEQKVQGRAGIIGQQQQYQQQQADRQRAIQDAIAKRRYEQQKLDSDIDQSAATAGIPLREGNVFGAPGGWTKPAATPRGSTETIEGGDGYIYQFDANTGRYKRTDIPVKKSVEKPQGRYVETVDEQGRPVSKWVPQEQAAPVYKAPASERETVLSETEITKQAENDLYNEWARKYPDGMPNPEYARRKKLEADARGLDANDPSIDRYLAKKGVPMFIPVEDSAEFKSARAQRVKELRGTTKQSLKQGKQPSQSNDRAAKAQAGLQQIDAKVQKLTAEMSTADPARQEQIKAEIDRLHALSTKLFNAARQ